MDLDNARRRGAPRAAPPPPPPHVETAPSLDTVPPPESDLSPRSEGCSGAVPGRPVDWCIETINATPGSIVVSACSRASARARPDGDTALRDDLHGALAHGTHSAPRRVRIAGDVLLKVRCNERPDVVRVGIAAALYAACASWAAGNVHVAVAGGAVVVTVHPFNAAGRHAALSMVKRSTRDVLGRHRTFEYTLDVPAPSVEKARSVAVVTDGPPAPPQNDVAVTVHDAAAAASSDVPRRRSVSRRASDSSDSSESGVSRGFRDGARQRKARNGSTVRRGGHRERLGTPASASHNMHVAQRYAYMLVFMLGTVSVAVLSVYIVFFGSLDFTLQTGIAFTRV